jgi:hypothetical protein
MRKVKRLRAIKLAVAEVDAILESLVDARVVAQLNSQQRRQLAAAHAGLSAARQKASAGKVAVPENTLVLILRCYAMAQSWVAELFEEVAGNRSRM